jgi:hypothetical protein
VRAPVGSNEHDAIRATGLLWDTGSALLMAPQSFQCWASDDVTAGIAKFPVVATKHQAASKQTFNKGPSRLQRAQCGHCRRVCAMSAMDLEAV